MAGPARSAGYADYSSSGTNKFIPEIWSGKLVEKFYDATVFSEIANTDYEGEIKEQGDTVKIRTIPSITINNYQIGQTLTVETPQSPSLDLLIDRAKYFAVICDDIDKKQSDLQLLDTWSQDASEQLKIVIDADVLSTIPADVHAQNQGLTAGRIDGAVNLGAVGAPIGLTKLNIIDKIVDLGQVMDEQNIPATGRWLVLPAWACNLIKSSDLKDASLSGDTTSMLRNGRVGMIDRFTIYMSNQVQSVVDGANTVFHIMAGHKVGLTFAAQMTKMESIRSTTTFGDIVRGLTVYGFKTTKPDALALLRAYKV